VIPGHEIVDLSLPLSEELPSSWPGAVPFQHKLFNWFKEGRELGGPIVTRGPFHTRWFMVAEHTGTHFDAPSHWVPPPDSGLPDAGPAGALSTDGVPLEQLAGPAVVVDLTGSLEEGTAGRSAPIEAEMLGVFEEEHGPFEPGEVVLLRTDWDRHYVEGPAGSRYILEAVAGRGPGWPAPTPDAISLLLERRVRCLGVDTPSVGATHDPYSSHIAGLPHGIVYVEGLTGLAQLPPRGATFLFLPIPLVGGSGAPGRAIALVPA
jgi:kynurenine formamidase